MTFITDSMGFPMSSLLEAKAWGERLGRVSQPWSGKFFCLRVCVPFYGGALSPTAHLASPNLQLHLDSRRAEPTTDFSPSWQTCSFPPPRLHPLPPGKLRTDCSLHRRRPVLCCSHLVLLPAPVLCSLLHPEVPRHKPKPPPPASALRLTSGPAS